MATLSLAIKSQDEYQDVDIDVHYDELPPLTMPNDTVHHFNFTSRKLLHFGDSVVCAGILSEPNQPDMRVVCKLVQGDISAALWEAELYTGKLAHLQGQDVPRFYGLFGSQDDYDPPVACMIIEYCGRTVLGWLGDCPMDIRSA